MSFLLLKLFFGFCVWVCVTKMRKQIEKQKIQFQRKMKKNKIMGSFFLLSFRFIIFVCSLVFLDWNFRYTKSFFWLNKQLLIFCLFCLHAFSFLFLFFLRLLNNLPLERTQVTTAGREEVLVPNTPRDVRDVRAVPFGLVRVRATHQRPAAVQTPTDARVVEDLDEAGVLNRREVALAAGLGHGVDIAAVAVFRPDALHVPAEDRRERRPLLVLEVAALGVLVLVGDFVEEQFVGLRARLDVLGVGAEVNVQDDGVVTAAHTHRAVRALDVVEGDSVVGGARGEVLATWAVLDALHTLVVATHELVLIESVAGVVVQHLHGAVLETDGDLRRVGAPRDAQRGFLELEPMKHAALLNVPHAH
eukprot:PhM_4_TR8339/c5_g1_i1/m.73334